MRRFSAYIFKLVIYFFVVIFTLPLNAGNHSISFDGIEKLAYSNPDKALVELSAIAKQLNNRLDTFNFLSTKAFINYRQLKPELAIKSIHELDSLVKINNSDFRKHYLTLAIILSDREDYQDAIMCLLKAIDEDPNIRDKGTPYLNLGYYYGIINEPDQEKIYMKTGYDLILKTDNLSKKAYACNMMGMHMERLEDFKSAIDYYNQGKRFAYNAKRWDKYIDNALAIASIEFNRGNLEKVEFILYQVENYYSECISPRAPAMGTLLFAKLCVKQKKLKKAELYYDLACRYSTNINYLPHLKDLYSFGIQLYSSTANQPMILEAFEKYKQIDSNSTNRSIKESSNINLDKLNYKAFNENISLRTKNYLIEIIACLIILVLLLILLIIRYRNKVLAQSNSKTALNLKKINQDLVIKIKDLELEINQLHLSKKQHQEEIDLIRFLFALPGDMRNYDFGPIRKLVNSKNQISDNALELLRARISSHRQLNFNTDHTKTYYANIELEKLNIPEKTSDKYARFFNLCMNLANSNYKVSEKDHIAPNKNELYYLCKTISGKSPAQLKEELIQPINE
ncbi:MAG: hypothetical protein N4A71_01920 [Carboxylicivirga sp.]|jgi:hypothetical protein|nr:hypothetical protein [Carboxylicivirga sp.]